MSHILIQAYLNEIDRLRKFSGSFTENNIREAFKDLLKAWSRQNHLHFVAELAFESSQKTRIVPDGTILHDLRVPLGYWEAKDTADDLDEEIRKKFAKGYPQDNIIFENSATAVLIQNRQEVMRCSMTDVAQLGKLVSLFFSYERQEIREFRKAVAQFRADLPAVLEALRSKIDTAYRENAGFITAAEAFLAQAKQTINPVVSEADVREMLIQHILTEEIFANVFNDSDFHRENNIAKALYGLEAKFFTGGVKKDTLKALEPYYAAIRANAAQITSHAEKQTFLKVIYENFYKVYNPKAADRLGVVYTPNEIVRFMIEGADWLCQKHFGKALIDRDVEILDPATGTGTFICELLEHFRGQPQKLAYKYKEELHANEVAILPYYVANLNIEATYATITGQFAEFPSLCFVDTLDNVEGLGIRSGHQHELFGAMSAENVERIKRQNRRKISVVIGNPPYNANQQNENDNNKNRTYKRIDERIKATYIKQSTAQKTKVYDMYARFFRWASDRLHDDGVLAFVTNRSFVDSRTFDGFRKAVADEFNEIYVVDLGGDVRANPKLSGTKHNVFGIQAGIAISFFVKRRKQKGCRIYYARRPEMETAEEKLAWLGATKASFIIYDRIEADRKSNWINVDENGWESLTPLADKRAKLAKLTTSHKAIFRLFSLGIVTNRDEWVYGPNKSQLQDRIHYFFERFSEEKMRWLASDRSEQISHFVKRDIKWTSELEIHLKRGTKLTFDENNIIVSLYRPFVKKYTYFAPIITHRPYQNFDFFPNCHSKNTIISLGIEGRTQFAAIAADTVANKDMFLPDAAQCVSRYRYTTSGERLDNITDWALKEFHKAYGKDGRGNPSWSGFSRPFPSSLGEDGGEDVDARYEGEHDGEDGASSPSPLAGEGRGEGSRDAARRMSTQGEATTGGASPHPAAAQPPSPAGGEGKRAARSKRVLTKDDIFHYVYGVLHDPVYRETYAQNLKREFPRIPFYPDFWRWAGWGETLMALHIGYESVEPWPLQRLDVPDEKARAAGVAPKTILKADRDNGIIVLDSETQLSGVPPEAWTYKLGNRSGLDWVLDQHKEKTPKDPTIREKFNTYRFADYKETVVDLLMRVTRVSVETMEITQAMAVLKRTG